jgi:hypothetical protein
MIQEENNPWINYIKSMLNSFGMKHVWNNQTTFSKKRLVYAICKQLESKYIQFWQTKKHVPGKLEFYNKITDNNYKIEYYLLKTTNAQHRKALSKLRISAHDLNIERGRYANIPRQERICSKCQVLEDEIHFLDSCSLYRDVRDNFIRSLQCNRTISDNVYFQLKPSTLMQEEDVQQLLAKYVYDCMLIR